MTVSVAVTNCSEGAKEYIHFQNGKWCRLNSAEESPCLARDDVAACFPLGTIGDGYDGDLLMIDMATRAGSPSRLVNFILSSPSFS